MRANRCLCMAAAIAATAAAALTAAADEPKSPWRAAGEVSYVQSTGNTSAQTLAAKLEASYEFNPNRYYGKTGWMYGKNDGNPTANKFFLDGRYERTITGRLFGFATANFVIDRFSGYDYQIYGGPGFGYEFVKTDKHQLKGLAAVLYSYDRFSESSEGHDTYAAGMAGATYEWKITDTVKFKEAADYRVSFEDPEVYFLNSNTGLEAKLASNLALGLGYLVSYRNHLPTADLKHTDTTVLTSLIVTF